MTILTYLLLAAALAVTGLMAARQWRRRGRDAFVPCLVSAAAGVLLFWLVRTAAERRVLGPGALFSFFADGTPRPGMAAALAVCLALCLFLGTTERGGALLARLDGAAEKNGALWLFALCVTAVFLAWTMRVTVPHFMTSDEHGIMQQIGEVAEQGAERAAGSYSHVLFCLFLALFYRLAPNGYWYTGYHLFALTVSLTVIVRCVLLKARGRGLSAIGGFGAAAAVCCLFMYSYSALSFTVTPAAAGSAAVALMLCRGDADTRTERVLCDVGGVVLMLMCYLQRTITGRCLLCFYGLACVYQLVKLLTGGGRGLARRIAALAACAAALASLLGAAHAVAGSDRFHVDEDAAYANSLRSAVVDFLVNDLTYEQYAEAGISQELAVLLHGWYFMDESLTVDTFQKLYNVYYADRPASAVEGITASPLTYLVRLGDSLKSDEQMLPRALCAVCLLLFSAVSLVRYRRRYLAEFLCCLFAFCGALLMLVYLVYGGRFPTRVFLVVAYPALVTMLLTALTVPEGAGVERRIAYSVPAGLLGAAILALCLAAVFRVPYAREYADRTTVFADQRAIEDYLNAHPDITYITNMYDSYPDPFHAPRYPENAVLWGSVGDIGLTEGRRYAQDFFRDDVRFLCRNPGYITFLLQYLTLQNGPVAARDEAHLTRDTFVYDVLRLTPDADYTGWYEWNGLRYLFENGEAVSGAYTANGEKYEFSPAGAAALPVIVTDGNDTYYATAAYSLAD